MAKSDYVNETPLLSAWFTPGRKSYPHGKLNQVPVFKISTQQWIVSAVRMHFGRRFNGKQQKDSIDQI